MIDWNTSHRSEVPIGASFMPMDLMREDGMIRWKPASEDTSGTPSASTRRRYISPKKRFTVLHRSGFRCSYCGASSEKATLVVDHIVPLAKGGTNHIDNLTAACDECNTGKSDSEITRGVA